MVGSPHPSTYFVPVRNRFLPCLLRKAWLQLSLEKPSVRAFAAPSCTRSIRSHPTHWRAEAESGLCSDGVLESFAIGSPLLQQTVYGLTRIDRSLLIYYY